MTAEFRQRYGPWGVIAGASEGLGAAFAHALGRRGVHVVLVARRSDALAELAEQLRRIHGIEVRCVTADLSRPDFVDTLRATTATLEIGTAIYNAASLPIGPLIETAPEDLLRVIDVNVRGPLLFARAYAPPMTVRGRGGLVIMSSLAALQGVPRLSTYAASKAFGLVLAEGLWGELRSSGVHVLACCAGAIRTPNFARTSARPAPGILEPEFVAERTLDALARGPRFLPGWINRVAAWILGRVLPRRTAVKVMAASTRDLASWTSPDSSPH